MSRRVSEATKIRERRGTGYGAAYRPWIKVSEFPGHLGVHHNPVDWKNGRQMELLSDGELWQYLILRWDDSVVDIREQYPLDLSITEELFKRYKGFKHPRNRDGLVHMTSDLLVDYIDGHQEVYSIKYSREDVISDETEAKNTAKKLWIERMYWEGRDVSWNLIFTKEINRSLAENIANIVYFWQPNTITDKVSLFKFLLAHKQIEIDIETHPIDALEFSMLARDYISDEQTESLIGYVKNLSVNLK